MTRTLADDICWVVLSLVSVLYYGMMVFGTAFFIALAIGTTLKQPVDQWGWLILWIFLAVGGFNVARTKGWEMMVYFLTNREEVRW